ncbi:hypothetical protein DUI87_31130 [Hirundo rustica rustica]|uniref:Peptidase A2 domain-containing protein n=1 Tax=Hirundo rustica rustica TaxID=333673 RepID=A0A3M0IUJ6_HIRRU|nr:hypothetical protein DUI87_31130 [Hirundo rustica rustica]
MFWRFINNCTQFVRGGVGDEALQSLLSFFSFESVISLLENVQGLLNVKDTTFLVFHLVSFLYMVYSFSRMSHTLLNTVGQQTETREQGDKSVTQAAAKPDSEAKTPAVAGIKKGKKHTDKTDRPLDNDSGERSSMPPDTQLGVKPPDTQSEAEATDDTQSEAEPTDTKSEAKSPGTKSGVQPTSTRSEAQPTATTSGARPTAARAGDTIESFSLKDLRSLRKDYTRRPDESIISCKPSGKPLNKRLREMAVAEIVFSDDLNTRNPDLVPCTPVMWRKLVRLGPQEHSSALAIMKWDETEETVLDMAKKLRTYADAMHGPTHAKIAALETQVQRLADKMEENHQELKEDILQISAVQIRWPGTSEPQKYEALVDTGAQCTLLPSRHVGEESVSIAEVTGGSQDFTLVEADVSLTGNEWKRHPIVTGPEAPCILSMDFLRNGYFKDPKKFRTTRDAVIPIHKIIRELETQGVVSKTHSPFNSPIWPVCKSDGECRLTVDYRALNEVTPPLSAAVPDMLELQYELESKAAKWYATIDIANAFFSIPLAAECRPQFAFT